MPTGDHRNNPDEESDIEEEITVILDEDIIDRNVPVDRGYAWVILAACLALMITINGSGRSFGIFFVELLKLFDATSSIVSFVMGAQFLAYSLSVFVVLNCLTELTTHRTLVLIGAVLCTVTFVIDAVSPSIGYLILAHIIQGIGIAFTFGPNVVIVGHYFKKYRGSANAIASCGSSLGQFCLSPFFSFLISYYGVRGALLLQAGLMLHCLIFASLLRPTDFFRRRGMGKNFLLNRDPLPARKDDIGATFSSSNSITIYPAITVTQNSNKNSWHNNNTTMTKHPHGTDDKSSKHLTLQIQNLLPEEITRRRESNPEHVSMLPFRGVFSINREHATSCDLSRIPEPEPSYYHQHKRSLMSDSMLGLGSVVSIQNISRRSSQVKAMMYMKKNSIMGESLPEAPVTLEPRKGSILRKLSAKVFSKIDFNLLKYKVFLVFLVGYNFGCCGSSIMHAYFPSHARDIGLSRKEGMFILSLSGLSDLIGRVCMSIMADRLCMLRSRLMSMFLFANGIACCCVPFVTSFYPFAAYSVLYGISGGLFFSCITTVLTDFIGVYKLAQGLGMGFLFQGFSASLAFPLHGFLRDVFGSYTAGFILNGVSLIASGVLFSLAPYAQKLDKTRERKQKESNDETDD